MSGARFAVVAAAGFGVQMGVLHVLIARYGVPSPLAVAIAVESAILHNFFWHERWTFARRGGPRGGRLGRLWRFNGSTVVVSVVGQVLITGAVLELLPMPVAVANAIAVAVLGLVNFVVADRWVFRGSGHEREFTT